ncbi:MAG TPA: XrtB/PEP-CTERM-associated transcriptional regulator EpsA [Steroidobacteraceae bacterium]|jgi:transcriptional regulator EpsA|nr:XrtB/PEP-CTERM-associated transcriptional regulator EpsA [Steroidobacteraceae bacterium]
MQAGDTQLKMHGRPGSRGPESRDEQRQSTGAARLLDPRALEALLLNIDASLRVFSRPQLFGWTQGMLQNLLRHELLLCALHEGRPMTSQVDCFASPWVDAERIRQLFQQDVELAAGLVRRWTESEFHPTLYDIVGSGSPPRGEFSAELHAIGTDSVLVHGTYDSLGKPVSLFVLGATSGELGPEREFLFELIAPFLHLAWMRSQLARAPEDVQSRAHTAALLTTREKEILRWIHLGKSNFEIGTILGISPLTVKNHVQKILRKLNVRNRTQAVGRALALRFLDP